MPSPRSNGKAEFVETVAESKVKVGEGARETEIG